LYHYGHRIQEVHVSRIQNSLVLARASWDVLREEKKLASLPLLSGIATLLLAATFAVPIALVAENGTNDYSASKPLVWILAFIGYVVLAFVVIFFNAALVFAADRKLKGQPVTIGEALRDASSRVHVLLPWAIVSATVSIILRAIEERAGIFGQIVSAIAGMAWSVVTFLVLPVLVFEGIGPIAAVKRSGALFKRTWGENLIANAGIGLVAFFAMLAGAIPCVLLIALGGPALVVGIVALVCWLVTVWLVASTLTGILQTALYRFATDGESLGFNSDQLRGAFRQRGERRGFFGAG
jgi:hypothetical protein